MGSQQPPSPPKTAAKGPLAGLVASLVTALKNIAIYPAAHPRVAAAASDFVTCLAGHCGNRPAMAVTARGEGLAIDGDAVDCDPAAAAWLVGRLREAGLRGVDFAADCRAADVLEFAAAFNKARGRSGGTLFAHWQDENPRLRPQPLRFAGHHGGAPGGANAAQGQGPGNSGGGTGGAVIEDARIRAAFDRMAKSEAVQQSLLQIERHSCDELSDDSRDIDLLAAVAELLPADICNDPAQIEEVIPQILARVELSLAEIVRKNAKVKGADLLRMALTVARKFFHTEAPAQSLKTGLPSGRPEDASILADLELLLKEVAALPAADGLQLPPACELVATAPVMARELFGIYLHTLATSDEPATIEALKPRLQRLVTGGPSEWQPLLDAYLRPQPGGSTIGAAGRLRVLDVLLQAGLGDFVRSRHYVDAAFIAAGFPEALPLAARVLGGSVEGRAVLREGIVALAPVLEIGGVAAAAKAGVLHDRLVVESLIGVGGDLVLPLLAHAATSPLLAVRQMLLDFARTLKVPVTEAVVLRMVESADALPRDYLQNLLGAAAQRRFDGPLRTASAELLRNHAARGLGRLPHAAMLDAIDSLALVPGPDTETVLRRVAAAGRWTRLGREARAVRRRAREVLAQLENGGPS